jgi:hypothetical protein
MLRPPGTPLALAALLGIGAAGLSACGDDLTLPAATLETESLTVTLYALTGTPVAQPSAYNIIFLTPVRTDRSTDFDFAVDMDTNQTGDTVVLILPRGAMGLTADGGVQKVDVPFDSLLLAPADGYIQDSALAVATGDVLAFASRRQTCNFGVVRPHYAKALVEAVDRVQRSVQLRMRIDPNCGYRGLAPGVPTS